jgi:hypothetical protein
LGVHGLISFILSDRASSYAGMGGLGLGLRYRLSPEFAVEGDVEFVAGTDYNGDDRRELSLLLNAVGTLNPQSPVRVFGFAGIGFSFAEVWRVELNVPPIWTATEYDYDYFGGNAGLGVEFAASRQTAMHVDLLGFIRSRIDGDTDLHPEFVDFEDGRTSNTSGGVLLRIGVMFSF